MMVMSMRVPVVMMVVIMVVIMPVMMIMSVIMRRAGIRATTQQPQESAALYP
jgi:NADH:ubiquinone oxidoreductase subunit 3 (subunit A)